MFPVDQVILLDEKRELEVRYDEVMKSINLPIWQAEAVGHQSSSTQRQACSLIPSCPRSTRSSVWRQANQRIGLLRCIEALRLHAAEHDGKLPASLSDVTVPLPDDPFTGKSFRYVLDGNTAHLRGTPPSGTEKDRSSCAITR